MASKDFANFGSFGLQSPCKNHFSPSWANHTSMATTLCIAAVTCQNLASSLHLIAAFPLSSLARFLPHVYPPCSPILAVGKSSRVQRLGSAARFYCLETLPMNPWLDWPLSGRYVASLDFAYWWAESSSLNYSVSERVHMSLSGR